MSYDADEFLREIDQGHRRDSLSSLIAAKRDSFLAEIVGPLVSEHRFVQAAEYLKLLENVEFRDSLSVAFASSYKDFRAVRRSYLHDRRIEMISRGPLEKRVHRQNVLGESMASNIYRPSSNLGITPMVHHTGLDPPNLKVYKDSNVDRVLLWCGDALLVDAEDFPPAMDYRDENESLEILEAIESADCTVWLQPTKMKRPVTVAEKEAARAVVEMYGLLNELFRAGFLDPPGP